jgi:hypothetical protein
MKDPFNIQPTKGAKLMGRITVLLIAAIIVGALVFCVLSNPPRYDHPKDTTTDTEPQENMVTLDIGEYAVINGTKIYYLGYVSEGCHYYVKVGLETPDGTIRCMVENGYVLRIGNETVKVQEAEWRGVAIFNSQQVKVGEFIAVNGTKVYNMGFYSFTILWKSNYIILAQLVDGTSIEYEIADVFLIPGGTQTLGNATFDWGIKYSTNQIIVKWPATENKG